MSGRVLIIVQNLPVPFDRRVWLECRALRDAGYDVTVICPRGKDTGAYQVVDGVTIHGYAPYAPGGSALGYVVEYAYSFLATLLLVLKARRAGRFDVVQACNPPDIFWPLARWLRLRDGTRFVFDHHDLCPELFESRFPHGSRIAMRGLLLLERATFRAADLVVSTNESYRRVAIRRGGKRFRQVRVVRTGPDPEAMKAIASVPAARRGRPHLVAYLGVMGPQDGVDVVLAAADHIVHTLGRTDIAFTLMGGGDCYADLVAQRNRLGLQGHVELPGRVPDAYVAEVLSTADVGLSPDPLNPLNDVSTMNKTMEYMAYGLPVVAFDLAETRVSAGEAAVYADPASGPLGLAEALVGLLDEPEARILMGKLGRERVERTLAWEHQAPAYLAVYDELAGAAGRLHTPRRGLAMKVVLFCGGLGMRMRADNQSLPKPMMPIGSRPVLWHIMRYFAHFGHTEFVLCLGHGAQAVKDYFLDYRETASNDFVLTKGGRHVDMLGTDISDWTITFIDTGIDTPIGERLRRVRPYLEGDEYFLANYGDVLTDAPMNDLIEQFCRTDAVAQFIAVKPGDSFHVVETDEDGRVRGLVPAGDLPFRINGGYFALRQGIFDYLEEGDDLVMDGCVKAARDGKTRAVRYDGFWAPMDTLKERTYLEDLYRRGCSPWALWRTQPSPGGAPIIPIDVPSVV